MSRSPEKRPWTPWRLLLGQKEDTPSARVWFLAVIAFLSVHYYGWSADFILAPRWGRLYWQATGIGVVAVLLLALLANRRGVIRLSRLPPSNVRPWRAAIAWFLVACLVPHSVALGVFHGLGNEWTRRTGVPAARTGVLKREHDQSRRRNLCSYRLTGDLLTGAIPAYVCITSRGYRALRGKNKSVTLRGRESAWGFPIEFVEFPDGRRIYPRSSKADRKTSG